MEDPRDVFPQRLTDLLASLDAPEGDGVQRVAWRLLIYGVTEDEVRRWADGSEFPCPRKFELLRSTLGVSRDELLT